MALGDSFTFGQGAEYEHAWPALLEAAGRGGPPVESINGGWVAASPTGYLTYLREFGMRYDPDLVIIMIFVGNDVVDELTAERGGEAAVEDLEFEACYLTNLHVRVGPIGFARDAFDALLLIGNRQWAAVRRLPPAEPPDHRSDAATARAAIS